MTMTVTKLDPKAVKEVVGKLPIEYVDPLLKDCNRDCNFLPADDASTDKKRLKIHREKLFNAIIDSNNIDIFTKAEDLAKSIDVHDEKIDPKQVELKKINAKAKEIREETKELDYIEQKDIKKKAQKLREDLSEEKSQELAQYYSEREKARAELYREKEREKGQKAFFKGLAVSIIDGLKDEFVEASRLLTNSAVKYAEELYSEIEKNPEIKINLDTEEGMKLIDANLDEASKPLVSGAINKSKLGLDYKKSPMMSALNTKTVKSKPQTVSVGVKG